jgi:hypothetical protein
MTLRDIAYCRLINQQILCPGNKAPGEIVASLGAMQAQDYLGALWAIGLRCANAAEADIEKAIADRSVIRSWPLRGTLHFVSATDVRWMVERLTSRVIAASKRRQEQLGIDDRIIARSKALFIDALQGGKQLRRGELYSLLEAAHINTGAQRGFHILWRLAHEGIICFAARKGKQPTFALIEEWARNSKRLRSDEALAELTRRYFTSHGPATLQDFLWWSGLKTGEAQQGIEMVASSLASETVNKTLYWMPREPPSAPDIFPIANLLPGFDEYIVGYKDRTAALDPLNAREIFPNNGRFMATMLLNGRVVGTWKRTLGKRMIVLTLRPFIFLKRAEKQAFAAAAERYSQFIGAPATVKVSS